MAKQVQAVDRSLPQFAPVFAKMSSTRIAETHIDLLMRWAETGIPNSGRRRYWRNYVCAGCKRNKRTRSKNGLAFLRCKPCRRKA